LVRLYLDEDVNVLLVSLLRARNIEVTSAREQRMLGSSDKDQLKHASNLGAGIVTHNRVDFEILFQECIEQGRTFGGIIVLVRRDVYSMARNLSRFVLTHDSIENQLWYI
jgi:hypothetical protein